ncbi:MAG: PilZ domain-containing protein [Candidatus Omnitrophota bacterium]
MIKHSKAERRLYPRLEKKLPLNVAADGYDFTTSTQNISCVGVYCRVNKYIPPFTKIAVKIRLPKTKDSNPKECNVECKGVIVRTEDEKSGGFNIAIFFNEIKDSQRHKISHYIAQFLSKTL